MRSGAIFFLSLCLQAACLLAPLHAQETATLDGTWAVVSVEVDGMKIEEKSYKNARVAIKGSSLKVLAAEMVLGTGSVVIDTKKEPHTLTVEYAEGEEYKGKKSLAIYKLEKERLTICWTLLSANRDRPTAFATAPKSGLALVVYERAKP